MTTATIGAGETVGLIMQVEDATLANADLVSTLQGPGDIPSNVTGRSPELVAGHVDRLLAAIESYADLAGEVEHFRRALRTRPTVLALLGELDVFTSPDLVAQLKPLHAQGRYEVLLDLAELDFCDSTGLGAFVGARKKAPEHGVGFGLVTAHAPFLSLLRSTGLDRIFDVYPTVLDAMAARAACADVRPARADGGSGPTSAN